MNRQSDSWKLVQDGEYKRIYTKNVFGVEVRRVDVYERRGKSIYKTNVLGVPANFKWHTFKYYYLDRKNDRWSEVLEDIRTHVKQQGKNPMNRQAAAKELVKVARLLLSWWTFASQAARLTKTVLP